MLYTVTFYYIHTPNFLHHIYIQYICVLVVIPYKLWKTVVGYKLVVVYVLFWCFDISHCPSPPGSVFAVAQSMRQRRARCWINKWSQVTDGSRIHLIVQALPHFSRTCRHHDLLGSKAAS